MSRTLAVPLCVSIQFPALASVHGHVSREACQPSLVAGRGRWPRAAGPGSTWRDEDRGSVRGADWSASPPRPRQSSAPSSLRGHMESGWALRLTSGASPEGGSQNRADPAGLCQQRCPAQVSWDLQVQTRRDPHAPPRLSLTLRPGAERPTSVCVWNSLLRSAWVRGKSTHSSYYPYI